MAAKAIYVEWDDACTSAGWFDPETEDMTPVNIKSLGFLIKETKDYITVSPGNAETGRSCSYLTIPKGWIKKRKYIKL